MHRLEAAVLHTLHVPAHFDERLRHKIREVILPQKEQHHVNQHDHEHHGAGAFRPAEHFLQGEDADDSPVQGL